MNRVKVAAWSELGLTIGLQIASPTGGAQVDEPYEEPHPDPLPQAIHAAAPNSGPIVEPRIRAVDGFVLVTYHSGGTERFYISRSPDFIADKIRAGKRARLPVIEFWDKPGHSGARRCRVLPNIVREVRVQHLEPDLDAIFDFDVSRYVL